MATISNSFFKKIFLFFHVGNVFRLWEGGLVEQHSFWTEPHRCHVNLPPVGQHITTLLKLIDMPDSPLTLSTDHRLAQRQIRGRVLTVCSNDINVLELAFVYFFRVGPLLRGIALEDGMCRLQNHYAFCLSGHTQDLRRYHPRDFVSCVPIVRVDFVHEQRRLEEGAWIHREPHRTLLLVDLPGLELK